MTLTPEAAQKIREALTACISTLQRAEKLIGSLNLHDHWHETGKEHGAYHDLLFKRIHAEEALALLPALKPKEPVSLRECAKSITQKFGITLYDKPEPYSEYDFDRLPPVEQELQLETAAAVLTAASVPYREGE